MWSFSRAALALLGLLALAGLGACGFRPMYGTASADPAVTEELASIQVGPILDRPGQMLHNALLTRLNPKGEPLRPRYSLAVTLTVTESQVALQKDNSATRALVAYDASYRLYQGEKEVTWGEVSRTLSYDFITEHYADITAAQDVRSRGAQVVAEEIRNQLSAYFIRRHSTLASGGTGAVGGRP